MSSALDIPALVDKCPDCEVSKKGRELYRHLFNVHSWTKEKIEVLKRENRNARAMSSTSTEVLWECECGLLYTSKIGFYKHRRDKKHGSKAVSIVCPMCEAHIPNHEVLVEHVGALHAESPDDYRVEMREFSDKEVFDTWKSDVEEECITRFIVSNIKRKPFHTVTYLKCSRASPRPSYYKEKAPVAIKRVVLYCTAFMTVKEKEGKFVVKFCRAHCGHAVEPAQLFLDDSSKQYVASFLRKGFNPRQVIDEIRKELRESGRHKRLYYITPADVRSIAIKYNVTGSRRDDDDATSVELRIFEQNPDDGLVRYHRARNVGGDSDYNADTERMVEKIQSSCNLHDDTFNVTPFHLRLTAVVVADEWDMGLPVAFMLSNKLRSAEVAVFFEEIKKIMPTFNPKFFISDDYKSFYNGYRRVFPNSRTEKLLCLFHVIQSVKKKSSEKLNEKSRLPLVLSTIRKLCRLSDPADFASTYATLLTTLNNEGEEKLVKYFEDNWSNRIREFCGFARRTACVNTTMLVERWHKRVKHELVRTKSGVRVDGLVDILINAPPLMEEDRMIKMSRNLNYGRRRLALHHAAHILAVKVYGNRVDAVKVVGEGQWCVSDKKGHHYVKQSTCICDEKINNHCKMCQVCAYAFTCDCVVDSTAGVSCLHVHAAATFAPNGFLRCNFVSDDMLPVEIEREVPLCDLDRSCSALSTGNDDSLDNLQEVEGLPCNDENNNDMFTEANTDLAVIRSLILKISKMSTDDGTETMRKATALIRNTKLELSTIVDKCDTNSAPRLARCSELSTLGRLPKHKPIRLQRVRPEEEKNKSKKAQEEVLNEVDVDKLLFCIIRYRRTPNCSIDKDVDDWLKCSSCGLWIHEDCGEVGSSCPYDDGHFQYAEVS